MTYLPSNVGIQKQATSYALDVNGLVNIDNTTVSTTPTTGAFVVRGGVGIVGDLNVGGNVAFGSATFNNITINGIATFSESAPTNNILIGLVTGEAFSRFYMKVTGEMNWGPGGAAAQDVKLSRTGTSTLGVTGNFSVSGNTNLTGNLISTGTLNFNNNIVGDAAGNLSITSLVLGGGSISGTYPALTTNVVTLNVTGQGTPQYKLDASGDMIWGAGMTLSRSTGGSVYAGKMVFNHLNTTDSFYLAANSLTTYIQGTTNNVSYYGNHAFPNGLSSAGEVILTNALTVKSSTTGFKTFSISNAGLLQWYNASGIAGNAQLVADTAANTVQSTGNMIVLGTLTGNGITSFGELKVVGGNFTLHNSSFNTDTTIVATATVNRALTTPDSSGVLVVDTASQILTNKTMSGLSLGQVTKVCPGYDDATTVSSFNYTGLAAGQGGLYGISDSSRGSGRSKIVTVTNNSGATLIIIPNSGAVPATDKIRTTDGNVIGLLPGNSIILSYDNSASVWGVVSSAPPKLAYYTGHFGNQKALAFYYYQPALSTVVDSYGITTTVKTSTGGPSVLTYTEFQMPTGIYQITVPRISIFVTGMSGASEFDQMTQINNSLETIQVIQAPGNANYTAPGRSSVYSFVSTDKFTLGWGITGQGADNLASMTPTDSDLFSIQQLR